MSVIFLLLLLIMITSIKSFYNKKILSVGERFWKYMVCWIILYFSFWGQVFLAEILLQDDVILETSFDIEDRITFFCIKFVDYINQLELPFKDKEFLYLQIAQIDLHTLLDKITTVEDLSNYAKFLIDNYIEASKQRKVVDNYILDGLKSILTVYIIFLSNFLKEKGVVSVNVFPKPTFMNVIWEIWLLIRSLFGP